MEYQPINLVMYDTRNSAATMLLDAYTSWYYGDKFNKTKDSWRYNVVGSSNTFEDNETDGVAPNPGANYYYSDAWSKTWGRCISNQFDGDGQYFFKRIDIYEIDGDTVTPYNIHNPLITTAVFDTKSHESSGEPALITCGVEYEGVTHLTQYDEKVFAGLSSESLHSSFMIEQDPAEHFYMGDDYKDGKQTLSYGDGQCGEVDNTSIIDKLIAGKGIPSLDKAASNINHGIQTGSDALGDVTGVFGGIGG